MDFNKYINARNVAIFGTITLHVMGFAVFTHLTLDKNYQRRSSELVINFIDQEKFEKVVEQEKEVVKTTKIKIFDEFNRPVTNQASNQSSEYKVEDLRSSMKSLEGVRENKDDSKDLFSDEALKRNTQKQKEAAENTSAGENEERSKKTSYTGQSTINYSLENRYSENLPNPIYTCPDGGLIYVDIKVNREGRVIDASYNSSKSSSSNECLIETAIKFAKRARFNANYQAPSSQKGYISYMFYKQNN